MSTQRAFARAAAIIMIASMLSRVLGFVREQIMAAKFGISGITDAYFAAFTIPDILYNLLVGGALSAALIPVFSEYLARDQEREGWRVVSILINVITLITIVASIFGMIFAPKLLPLVAQGLKGDRFDLAVKLTRIIFFSVLFTAFNGLQMGILNSYKHFTAPALGSLFYNIGIIGVGVAMLPFFGNDPYEQIKGFAFGVITGTILSFLIQIPQLIKRGLLKWYRLDFNIFHPGIRRIFILMVPVTIALSVSQINLIVNQDIASTLPAGIITSLRLANRIMMLPLGVFGSAIAIAIYPNMTNLVAKKRLEEFKETTSLGIRSNFLVIIPASVGMIALGVPLVRLMFEHGQVTHQGVINTAQILAFYSLGLFAQSGSLIIIRSFYALQDTITPLTFGLVTIALNYILNKTFVGPLGANGLALAYSLTGLFDFLSLTFLLRKKTGRIRLTNIVTSFIKITAASIVMGIAIYYISGLIEQILNIKLVINQLIQVLVSIVAAIVIYMGIILALKMEEGQLVLGILKRKFTR